MSKENEITLAVLICVIICDYLITILTLQNVKLANGDIISQYILINSSFKNILFPLIRSWSQEQSSTSTRYLRIRFGWRGIP